MFTNYWNKRHRFFPKDCIPIFHQPTCIIINSLSGKWNLNLSILGFIKWMDQGGFKLIFEDSLYILVYNVGPRVLWSVWDLSCIFPMNVEMRQGCVVSHLFNTCMDWILSRVVDQHHCEASISNTWLIDLVYAKHTLFQS